ncbi:MAG: beta-ketoacyl synthase N-terminal-like domain-containing protein [Verrucomicrobiota bacterium]
MNSPVILAASYLGPEGHGNDQVGLRPWPAKLAASFERGDLTELHWSWFFPSDSSRIARMDLMCRLGLMAAELLESGLEGWDSARRERVGVCVETCAGSLATDVRFLQTPKPTLFTYTLPSTVIGELCIRYRLKGPVLCLISESPAQESVLREAVTWLTQNDAEACLCLQCEAVDQTLAATVPLPGGLRPGDWRAGALLLGKPRGEAREYPLSGLNLRQLCRELCGGKPS